MRFNRLFRDILIFDFIIFFFIFYFWSIYFSMFHLPLKLDAKSSKLQPVEFNTIFDPSYFITALNKNKYELKFVFMHRF